MPLAPSPKGCDRRAGGVSRWVAAFLQRNLDKADMPSDFRVRML